MQPSPAIAILLGLFLGGLSFTDLVGDDPDTGILPVGPEVVAWALRAFALALVLSGAWDLARRRGHRSGDSSSSKMSSNQSFIGKK